MPPDATSLDKVRNGLDLLDTRFRPEEEFRRDMEFRRENTPSVAKRSWWKLWGSSRK